jgi:hypothetical protein
LRLSQDTSAGLTANVDPRQRRRPTVPQLRRLYCAAEHDESPFARRIADRATAKEALSAEASGRVFAGAVVIGGSGPHAACCSAASRNQAMHVLVEPSDCVPRNACDCARILPLAKTSQRCGTRRRPRMPTGRTCCGWYLRVMPAQRATSPYRARKVHDAGHAAGQIELRRELYLVKKNYTNIAAILIGAAQP